MIQVTVAGNVGKDAEMRRAGDQDVCGFSLAGETPKKETIWFDVSIWGRRGEGLCKYIRKGDKITVTGALSTREHDGKTYFKIDASDIALQGSGRGGEERDDRKDDRRRDDDRRPEPMRDERRDDRREPRRDDRREERRDDRRSAPANDARNQGDQNWPY